MSYLQPPPNMSPVVVVKDFGGYVDAYAAATEMYRQTNREVRIHECHSACTMALSLPNVCVYRSSIFKFHQAYDPRNHVTNWAVSDALFHTYPDAVRERLGTLTKQFTIMRGSELIDLGVRDCNQGPEPPIMVATATSKPIGEGALSGGGFAALTGRLQGMIPNFGAKPELVPDTGRPAKRAAPMVPAEALAPAVPLPPERPADMITASIEEPRQSTELAPGEVPMPPPRPKILVAYAPSLPPIPFMQKIDGSVAGILPSKFVPFARRAI